MSDLLDCNVCLTSPFLLVKYQVLLCAFINALVSDFWVLELQSRASSVNKGQPRCYLDTDLAPKICSDEHKY